jgi:FKBP-type peptidyl-prolyl cis-trans isomerase FkpA
MLMAAAVAQAQQAQPEAAPARRRTSGGRLGHPGPAAEQLIVTDTVVGTGKEATVGATVYMHYSGWLYRPLAKNMHGKLFDSSIPRGEPLDFVLGAGRVIKGWDQGIKGMKVGGKRTLIIRRTWPTVRARVQAATSRQIPR